MEQKQRFINLVQSGRFTVSAVGEVLRRHGMVEVRKRRWAVFKVERGALAVPEHSNHVTESKGSGIN